MNSYILTFLFFVVCGMTSNNAFCALGFTEEDFKRATDEQIDHLNKWSYDFIRYVTLYTELSGTYWDYVRLSRKVCKSVEKLQLLRSNLYNAAKCNRRSTKKPAKIEPLRHPEIDYLADKFNALATDLLTDYDFSHSSLDKVNCHYLERLHESSQKIVQYCPSWF